MKIRFSFDTTRAVPFYARLCNQFLRHPLVMGVTRTDDGYQLEAEGDQQGLSDLAELIGRTFPHSCFLTAARTEAIEQFSGEAVELATRRQAQPFCRLCRDQLYSDCIHCGAPAENELLPDGHSLKTYVAALADTLEQVGRVVFQSRHGQCTLYRLARAPAHCDQLLFCQPEALNSALHIGDRGIKLLGSIEKPRLRLVPRDEFVQAHQMARALYHVQLADDRLTLALTEHLAERGITAVAYDTDYRALTLGLWGEEPAVLCSGERPQPVRCHEPRRAQIQIRGLSARWDGDKVRFESGDDRGQRLAPEYAAACALAAERQRYRAPKHTAVLYLSREHHSGLIHQGSDTPQWMVRLPNQPLAIDEVLAAIRTRGTGSRLLAQYEAKHPALLNALVEHPGRQLDGSLTSVLAMMAWFAGLDDGDDAAIAAERLLATAIRHDGPAPRIDFKLKRVDEVLEVDWTAAFQACLSYRLADPEAMTALTFGVIDSFADFVANWAEQLDNDIGLDEVVLAGNEFDNPLLMDRLRLRLGKNLALRLPDPLGIAGTNLALGALHLADEPLLTVREPADGQAA